MSTINVEVIDDFIGGGDISLDDEFDLGLVPTPITASPVLNDLETLTRPCFVIDNPISEYEIVFLKSRALEEPIPIYVKSEGEYVPIAKSDLDLKAIITFRRLGFNTLLITPDCREIVLSELTGEKLLNFIKL